MSITKQFLKTKPECKVKFTVYAEDAASFEAVALVGDFNSWAPAATPMKKQKNGDFSATLTLPAGASYKFRYLGDGAKWFNDACADGYEYCPLAEGDNAVLQL